MTNSLRAQVPPHCVPIHANVTTYNWDALAAAAQFDVIMMDPPWALATANPTRGVSLGYRSVPCCDELRRSFPMPHLTAYVLGLCSGVPQWIRPARAHSCGPRCCRCFSQNDPAHAYVKICAINGLTESLHSAAS